ncbi:hypothetical protein J1N35_035094 [Gossypium stocksii]|uniref:Uncharacterized protein n=1 Tax=Gossypium stocksii TaxID=47602 RepID=A0A9D3UU42_9ROSI|nr:hypothetical protein J1N35_035094 [Gossypium stocksii]
MHCNYTVISELKKKKRDMGSLQQQQGGDDEEIRRSWVGGSNRIAALNVEPGTTTPQSSPNNNSSKSKHLSELCKAEYSRLSKYCLWILAEIAVIAADIPESFLLLKSPFTL